MVHTMEGLSLKSSLRSFNVLVFLLLMHFYEGQSQAMAPSQPVVSMVGGDAVLPCQLEACFDAAQVTVEWGRPDLEPRFGYIWHNGKEITKNQNAAYKGRASMSADELKQGNASLKLTQLRISDNGRYRCYIPKQKKEYFVELLVGSVSSPGITLAGLDKSSSSVELECKSAGWYPEPEVLWLDGDGNLLSAGPTKTVRGPDDLYTVSKRAAVEKKHGNKFTCRVQQNNINQTRETVIHVSDDFFEVSSSCAASVTFSVMFGLLLVLAVSLLIWKWKQNKSDKAELEKKISELQKDSKKEQNLVMTLKNELEKKISELQKVSKKEQDLVMTLMEVKNELENWRNQLRGILDDVGEKKEENKQKLQSVEKEITKREATFDKPEELLKEKENLLQDQWKLDQIKKDTERQLLHIEKLMDPIELQVTEKVRMDRENMQT